jgi:hypothetical protein
MESLVTDVFPPCSDFVVKDAILRLRTALLLPTIFGVSAMLLNIAPHMDGVLLDLVLSLGTELFLQPTIGL